MSDLDQSPAVPYEYVADGPTEGWKKDFGPDTASPVVPGGADLDVQYNNFGTFDGLSNTDLTTRINVFTPNLKGSVPPSGGNILTFLRADGIFAEPPAGGGGGPTPPGGNNLQIQYNNNGAFGGLTDAQITARIQQFSASISGAVPPSGGGTTNFLRADGIFAAPPTGGGGGGPSIRVQRSVTSGPITILSTDEILNLNLSTPTNINLPASSTRAGLPLTFKDVGGQAATNNITLTPVENIDGAANFVMSNDRMAITINPFNDGVNTGWFIT